MIDPGRLLVVDPSFGLGDIAADVPLDEHIDLVIGQHPDRPGGADQFRLVHHHLLELIAGAGTDQLGQHPFILAIVHLGKERQHPVANQGTIVGGGQVIDVEDGRVKVDIELDLGLAEGGIALGDDRGQQQGQKQEACDDRRQPEQPEPFFLAVTGRQADIDPVHGGDFWLVAHGGTLIHILHGICAPHTAR